MEFNYDFVIAHLKKCKKAELFDYLDHAIDLMNEAQLDDLFGDIQAKEAFGSLLPEQVLAKIQTFRADSLARKYYAPFLINSKNHMHVPPKTDKWFRELSRWIDRACELVEEGQTEIARQCLEICMDLIERMENIVFGDELGDWMVNSKHDYPKIYQKLSSKK